MPPKAVSHHERSNSQANFKSKIGDKIVTAFLNSLDFCFISAGSLLSGLPRKGLCARF